MNIFQHLAGTPDGDDELSDALYTLVATEMSQGKIIKPLWTKALAHCDFEPTRTQAFYVRERVARLQKNIEEIRQYISTSKRLQEACERHEFDAKQLGRMKADLKALAKTIESKRLQFDQDQQEVRQRIHDELSPDVEKNKLYTWAGTAAVVALLIPAYFLGFLNSGELYLALFLIIVLAAVVLTAWGVPLENKISRELRTLENLHNISSDTEKMNKLRREILQLESQIQSTNEIDTLKARSMALESRVAPLFQYDSPNN